MAQIKVLDLENAHSVAKLSFEDSKSINGGSFWYSDETGRRRRGGVQVCGYVKIPFTNRRITKCVTAGLA